ncbi:MAG: hypothetical protein GF355_07660 [Candidatus Eisenbacteria bacterium]|nr:hypothetical protein [Candidatus Eisenbacteria bacterium]
MRLGPEDRSQPWRGDARLIASVVAVILATALIPGCSDDDGGSEPVIERPQDLLPPGTETMVADGDPRIATDASGLQEIVNGGYETYTNHGFQELAEQKYNGQVGEADGVGTTIWIFDMGSGENAAELQVELTREGPWQESDQFGAEEHRLRSSNSQTILFRLETYSVRLVIGNGSNDAEVLLELFAEHIEGEILN